MLKDAMLEAVSEANRKGYTDVKTSVPRSEFPGVLGMLGLVTAIGDELDLRLTWDVVDGIGDNITIVLDWATDDLDACSDAMAALYAHATEIMSNPLYAD